MAAAAGAAAASSFGKTLAQGAAQSAVNTGVSSLSGGFFNWLNDTIFGNSMRKRQLKFMEQQLQQNQKYQLDYEKKHAEMFSKSWERAQLEAAGLNPAIMYGGRGSAGSSGVSSAKSLSSPTGMMTMQGNGTPMPYGQIEVANSQARLNDAQAAYWQNKATTEEKMPTFIEAQTKMQETLDKMNKALQPLLVDEKKANINLTNERRTLTALDTVLAEMGVEAAGKTYTFTYKDSYGHTFRQKAKGYEVPYLVGFTTLSGKIMENTQFGTNMPVFRKQSQQVLQRYFIENRILNSRADIAAVESYLARATQDFKFWQEHYRTDLMGLEKAYQQWVNDTAEDNRQWQIFREKANIALAALGVATDMATGYGHYMNTRPMPKPRLKNTMQTRNRNKYGDQFTLTEYEYEP